MSIWLNVFYSDAKRILRDPFFSFIMIAPLAFGLVLRWVLPVLNVKFQTQLDLAYYYPLVIALFLLTPPMYSGMVMAFQILEEKDENVLLAIAVTPFALKSYFILRIFMYALISIPIMVIVHMEIALLSISTLKLWAVAVVAALGTPILALIVAGFAKNQVEGFAVMKGSGFLILFPLATFFVPAHWGYWHVLCGILPTYWPIIAYFTAIKAGGSQLFFWIAIVMAIITQTIAIGILYTRFEKNILGR